MILAHNFDREARGVDSELELRVRRRLWRGGAISRRFLRNYFALAGVTIPNLDDALKHGEGQSIEFKRAISEQESRAGSAENELLKSVAAFANTNSGVIFIGVDDNGRAQGLELNAKQRDVPGCRRHGSRGQRRRWTR